MSLRGDDIGGFWSTGIWVALRIFLIPSIVFSGFVLYQKPDLVGLSLMNGSSSAGLPQIKSQNSSGLDQVIGKALGQLDGALGGGTTSSHNAYFKVTKGAKWVRP